ncbi:MAG: outer membrane protein assembly factor BamD [Alistipes sp.]|nr:outer membrane protein assembly factor BamD [Alistipes sp.]
MKRLLTYILALATAALTSVSCDGVNQALKTNDPQYAYEQALKFYGEEKWRQASDLFTACRHVYVGSPREDSLSFYNAHCKFKDRNWDEASMLLDEFRRKFGRSPFIEDAEGMYALCYFYMSPDPQRDQSVTTEAIIAITEFQSRYPNSDKNDEFSEMLDILTERLMEKSYLNAYTYYKIGRYKSAIVAFKNSLKQYPESHRKEDIMYYTTVSAYRLAANSIESKQMDRYLATIDYYFSFISEFPESKYRKELENIVERSRDFIDKNRKTE